MNLRSKEEGTLFLKLLIRRCTIIFSPSGPSECSTMGVSRFLASCICYGSLFCPPEG